jgi:hypothetical protein
VRTGTSGGASTLAAGGRRHDNFVDLDDPSGFERGDHVVIDDGVAGREEYLRVQLVDGNRLWFSAPNLPAFAPGLRTDHAAGVGVAEVQLLARLAPTHYQLDAATGTLTEVVEFGDGADVLVGYTADWRVPSDYPAALNASPERTDQHGQWTGKALVAGTYRAALSASRDVEYRFGTAVTPYRKVAPGATRDVRVGDAFELETRDLVDGTSCNACHQELVYHGLYRGFDTCLICHGASGTEDLPRYAAANAPETPGLSVEFRALIHKIHRGRELADESFRVVAAAGGAYPDNFTTRAYHDFATLPSFPARSLDCARCHGADNLAALLPAEREHPSDQDHPMQLWRPACAGCHDSEPVMAHLDSNTAPNGGEACAICHDAGEFTDARAAHLGLLPPR